MNERTKQWLDANLSVSRGELKLQGNRTTATLQNTGVKLLTLGLNVPSQEEWDEYRNDVISMVQVAQAGATNGFKLYDKEQEFVQDKLDDLGIIFKDNGTVRTAHETGELVTGSNNVVGKLKLEMALYNRSRPNGPDGRQIGHKLLSELIMPAYENIEHEFFTRRLVDVREKLKYNPDPDFVLDEWVTDLLKIYGTEVTDKPQQVAAFKHLLWQIKRKLFGHITIAHPLMVVIYSHKGGTGKTKLLECLMGPMLWAYNGDGRLSDVIDGNEYKAMVQGKYLVDFAELAITRAIRDTKGNVDIGALNAIKSAFTSPTVSKRRHYGTVNDVIDQTAVFASSSNMHVYDIFKDTSGMRRFYEIKVNPDFTTPLGKNFWKKALPLFACMEQVYQQIDENDDRGYFYPNQPYYNEIAEEQDEMSRIDAFGQFCALTRVDIISEEKDGYLPVNITKVRSDFNKFMEKRGDYPWTMGHLTFILAQKDITPVLVLNSKGLYDEVLYVKQLKDGDKV